MRSRKVPTKKVELKPFVLWVRAVRKTDLGLSLGESVCGQNDTLTRQRQWQRWKQFELSMALLGSWIAG